MMLHPQEEMRPQIQDVVSHKWMLEPSCEKEEAIFLMKEIRNKIFEQADEDQEEKREHLKNANTEGNRRAAPLEGVPISDKDGNTKIVDLKVKDWVKEQVEPIRAIFSTAKPEHILT